jgi:hypothetical protein
MHVHDISSIAWEILRLRRCKVVIINSASAAHWKIFSCGF